MMMLNRLVIVYELLVSGYIDRNDSKILDIKVFGEHLSSTSTSMKSIVHCYSVLDLLHIGHIKFF